jgi:tropomodulin
MTATKTTTMTTRKLYGKDLSEYENMDVDELLSQLTPEELDILSKDVDPDVKITWLWLALYSD